MARKKKLNTNLDGLSDDTAMVEPELNMDPVDMPEEVVEGDETHYVMGNIESEETDTGVDEEFEKASKKLKLSDVEDSEDEWVSDDFNLDDTDDFAKYENYDPDNPDEYEDDF